MGNAKGESKGGVGAEAEASPGARATDEGGAWAADDANTWVDDEPAGPSGAPASERLEAQLDALLEAEFEPRPAGEAPAEPARSADAGAKVQKLPWELEY